MWFNWRNLGKQQLHCPASTGSHCWLGLLLTGEIISGFHMFISVKMLKQLFSCPGALAGYLRVSPLLPLPYLKWGRGESCGRGVCLWNSFGLWDIINTDCLDDWVSEKECKSLHLAGASSLNWNKTPCWYSQTAEGPCVWPTLTSTGWCWTEATCDLF